jgi:hypothetical protein
MTFFPTTPFKKSVGVPVGADGGGGGGYASISGGGGVDSSMMKVKSKSSQVNDLDLFGFRTGSDTF